MFLKIGGVSVSFGADFQTVPDRDLLRPYLVDSVMLRVSGNGADWAWRKYGFIHE
jgi:hypothetical protein